MLLHCADGQKVHLVKAEPFEPLNLDLDRTHAHPEAKEGVRRLIISPAEHICKIFTLKSHAFVRDTEKHPARPRCWLFGGGSIGRIKLLFLAGRVSCNDYPRN